MGRMKIGRGKRWHTMHPAHEEFIKGGKGERITATEAAILKIIPEDIAAEFPINIDLKNSRKMTPEEIEEQEEFHKWWGIGENEAKKELTAALEEKRERMSDDDYLARGDKTRVHNAVATTKWRCENGKRGVNVDLERIEKNHIQMMAENRQDEMTPISHPKAVFIPGCTQEKIDAAEKLLGVKLQSMSELENCW